MHSCSLAVEHGMLVDSYFSAKANIFSINPRNMGRFLQNVVLDIHLRHCARVGALKNVCFERVKHLE
jgi:hypothetical protein